MYIVIKMLGRIPNTTGHFKEKHVFSKKPDKRKWIIDPFLRMAAQIEPKCGIDI